MAVSVLQSTQKSQWEVWSAPNTCPHESYFYVVILDYNLVLCRLDLPSHIDMEYANSLAVWKQYRWKIALLKSMYRLIHTCTFIQTVHLVLTYPLAHLGLVKCEGPPLCFSQRDAGCCGLGLGCGSQTLLQILSVSLCCPPWLREAGQQSRFLCFYTLVKAATANTHQHSSTWRQLTPFSLLLITEQLALGKTSFVCMCVCMIGRLSSKVINSDRLSMVLQNVL